MSDLDVGRIVVDKLGWSLWVVELDGEHDLSNVGKFQAVLAGIFAEGTTVVVDLSGVTFLDSSVLSELILAQQRVDGDPGEELAIVAPRDGVAARLIDLVDAGRMFSMFETRAKALQSIGRTPLGGGESWR
jgi:anti-anti-sigma factor